VTVKSPAYHDHRLHRILLNLLNTTALASFMQAYPEIILDLDFSDRVVDVIEEGFDAVVRFAEVGTRA
jgi:DNA-binding transcriptional LysR family regulator